MLKERFQLKIRPVHVLAVCFLGFMLYVGLAALPSLLIQTGETMQGDIQARNYIRQTNDLYEGMLRTDPEVPHLQNKGTYINLNGFMAKTLGRVQE